MSKSMVKEKENQEDNTLFGVTLRAVRSENIYLSIDDIAHFLEEEEKPKERIEESSRASLQA